MYTACWVLVASLLIISGLHYVYMALARKSDPVPATWIMMSTSMTLACIMYLLSPNRSFTRNISVTAGVVNVNTILLGVLYSKWRQGNLRVSFDLLQIFCLKLSVVVAFFWAVTVGRYPLTAYVGVQVIALIGYVGTVRKLWVANGSTEPLFLWVSVFVACCLSIYPAFMGQHVDRFACVYLVRALPSTIFVIWLIQRAKRRG